jgi:acyl dehydratase
MAAHVIESPKLLQSLVHQEIGVSDWFRVSQDMIDAFADCIRDRQWIHIDRPRPELGSLSMCRAGRFPHPWTDDADGT